MLKIKPFTKLMQLTDFDYILPEELIAAQPLINRSDSKLLRYQNQSISDHNFYDLPNLLTANDLLIFNDTKVINARLYGQKTTGGKIECLVETFQGFQATCLIKGKIKLGQEIIFSETIKARVITELDQQKVLEFNLETATVLEQIGTIPIPPYFKRAATLNDQTRYQTIYAKYPGAIAAPTAGLHFDNALLTKCTQNQIKQSFVTLHVGAGTFKPVQTADITQHKMHAETYAITEECIQAIQNCKANGGRIIAVGTTVLRTLETMMQQHKTYKACTGVSEIFIHPGFEFQLVDGLITNFHLPKSTLLMLISAFIGHTAMHKCYQHAIANHYRFYSYGDAMLIL